MARNALHWRGLVEKHLLTLDVLEGAVAPFALHTGVAALQRELCAPVVIEQRRNPALRIVAVGAGRAALSRNKLSVMRVHVAPFAGRSGSLELDLFASGQGLVTTAALHRAVHALQRKIRLAVVKSADLRPRRS